MYIDLNLKPAPGPDDSPGEVLGIEFARPIDEDGKFSLNLTTWHMGEPPSRSAVIAALGEVAGVATYAICMLWMQSEGLGEEIERLADAIERQSQEVEEWSEDLNDCEHDDGTDAWDPCPSCVAEHSAEAARAREELAALARERDALSERLRADEDVAIEVGNKVARIALFGLKEVGVTPPVTERLCACGCGQAVTSPRPEAQYATGACRVTAHRARRAVTP